MASIWSISAASLPRSSSGAASMRNRSLVSGVRRSWAMAPIMVVRISTTSPKALLHLAEGVDARGDLGGAITVEEGRPGRCTKRVGPGRHGREWGGQAPGEPPGQRRDRHGGDRQNEQQSLLPGIDAERGFGLDLEPAAIGLTHGDLERPEQQGRLAIGGRRPGQSPSSAKGDDPGTPLGDDDIGRRQAQGGGQRLAEVKAAMALGDLRRRTDDQLPGQRPTFARRRDPAKLERLGDVADRVDLGNRRRQVQHHHDGGDLGGEQGRDHQAQRLQQKRRGGQAHQAVRETLATNR